MIPLAFVNRKGEGRISPFLLSRVTDKGLGAIFGWRIARMGPQDLENFAIDWTVGSSRAG
jgi:hypothetical protein